MNLLTKKIVVSSWIVMLIIVSGCSSSSKKEEQKKEEKQTVKMVANNLYLAPLNPSMQQIIAYNKLSEAIQTNNKQEEATMVAVNFAFDFFSLSNKKDSMDIGGLQFIATDKANDYVEYAKAYYYGNYPRIVNEFGKTSLPQVDAYTVDSVTKGQYPYANAAVPGYAVKLKLTYADTKVEKLKENLTIAVIQVQDIKSEQTRDENNDLLIPGDMTIKTVYRVLSVQ